MSQEEKATVGTWFVVKSGMGFGCYEVYSIVNGHANAQCKGIVQTSDEVRLWMKGRWPEKMVPMIYPGLNGRGVKNDNEAKRPWCR